MVVSSLTVWWHVCDDARMNRRFRGLAAAVGLAVGLVAGAIMQGEASGDSDVKAVNYWGLSCERFAVATF